LGEWSQKRYFKVARQAHKRREGGGGVVAKVFRVLKEEGKSGNYKGHGGGGKNAVKGNRQKVILFNGRNKKGGDGNT